MGVIGWLWLLPFWLLGFGIGWSVRGLLAEREEDRREGARWAEFDERHFTQRPGVAAAQSAGAGVGAGYSLAVSGAFESVSVWRDRFVCSCGLGGGGETPWAVDRAASGHLLGHVPRWRRRLARLRTYAARGGELEVAEARGEECGRRWAITALRDDAAAEVIFENSTLNSFESALAAHALADHLEAIAEEGK